MQLLEAIAPTNRGLLTDGSERLAILAMIAQLEDYNPNVRPLEVPELLEGNWRLLYTSSRELLNLNNFPLLKLGQVYQWIRGNRIYNIAEFTSVIGLASFVSVAASFVPTSEKRVSVQFERFISGLQGLIGYQSPRQFIEQIEMGRKFTAIDFSLPSREPSRQGWLDITYLDNDLRIGRGNEGSVFVLTKAA